jgi:hypothetical protein
VSFGGQYEHSVLYIMNTLRAGLGCIYLSDMIIPDLIGNADFDSFHHLAGRDDDAGDCASRHGTSNWAVDTVCGDCGGNIRE